MKITLSFESHERPVAEDIFAYARQHLPRAKERRNDNKPPRTVIYLTDTYPDKSHRNAD